MVEGANEEQTTLLEVNDKREWIRTSALMAQMHNVQCTKRNQLVEFNRFDPYAKGNGRVTTGMLLTRENVGTFISALSGGRKAVFKKPMAADPRERPGTIVKVLGETNDCN